MPGRFGPAFWPGWHVTCDSSQRWLPHTRAAQGGWCPCDQIVSLGCARPMGCARRCGGAAGGERASAQDCEKDADCGDGYVCKSAATGVQSRVQASRAPDDAAASRNRRSSTRCPPDCTTEDVHILRAQAVHHGQRLSGHDGVLTRQTSATCARQRAHAAARLCMDGKECPTPEPRPRPPPDQCMTHHGEPCTPRWAVPCKQAADCGEGFDCKELIEMSLRREAGGSGAGGAARRRRSSRHAGRRRCGRAAAAGAAESRARRGPTGEFVCELKDLPCDTDDDCPAGLECTGQLRERRVRIRPRRRLPIAESVSPDRAARARGAAHTPDDAGTQRRTPACPHRSHVLRTCRRRRRRACRTTTRATWRQRADASSTALGPSTAPAKGGAGRRRGAADRAEAGDNEHSASGSDADGGTKDARRGSIAAARSARRASDGTGRSACSACSA